VYHGWVRNGHNASRSDERFQWKEVLHVAVRFNVRKGIARADATSRKLLRLLRVNYMGQQDDQIEERGSASRSTYNAAMSFAL